MTSEEVLGFTTPPEHQCDIIDTNIEDTKLSLGPEDHIDNYESLRTACDELRNWGTEWKELAKELINKYEPELLYGEEI